MHLLRRIITVNVAANKRVVQIFLVSTYEKCYHCPSDILYVWDKIYKNLHFSMGYLEKCSIHINGLIV